MLTESRLTALFSVLLLGAHLCLAETELVLSNGQKYKGTVVSESETAVELDVSGNRINIFKSMIVSRTGDQDASSAVVQTPPPSSSPAPAAAAGSQPRAVAPASTSRAAAPESAPPMRKVTLDVSISSQYQNETESNYETKVDQTSAMEILSIIPSVGIRVNKVFEIRPAIGFGLSSRSTSTQFDGSSSDSVSSSLSYANLSFQVAFPFYLVSERYFRLSLGPALYYRQNFEPNSSSNGRELSKADTYINLDVGIKAPLAFDIVLRNRVGFRFSQDVLGVMANVYYYKDESSNSDRSEVTFYFDLIAGGWVPQVGFFVLF